MGAESFIGREPKRSIDVVLSESLISELTTFAKDLKTTRSQLVEYLVDRSAWEDARTYFEGRRI